MRHFPVLALLALATACAPTTPRPAVRQAPIVALPPPPPASPALGPDWRDWPATPGTWRYARDDRGTIASFGEAGGAPLALLRCDPAARRLFLSRSGTIATPLTVRTTSVTRQLPTGATGGDPAYVAALLPAGDPLLDAIAFSRGRFTVEQAGAAPLVLPSWAEVGRVIEDCRG